MKNIKWICGAAIVLSTLVGSLSAHAQGGTSVVKDSLNVIAMLGTWSNVSNARVDFSKPQKGFDQAKDVALPGSSTTVPFIQFKASGELNDPRLFNAKWKIVNYSSLVIIPEFGREFKAFVTRDDSTHRYKITINGETFEKLR